MKAHLNALMVRGLVMETEGIYQLTDNGKRVLESFRAMEVVKAV